LFLSKIGFKIGSLYCRLMVSMKRGTTCESSVTCVHRTIFYHDTHNGRLNFVKFIIVDSSRGGWV